MGNIKTPTTIQKVFSPARTTLWILISVSGTLIARLFHFALKYSVNILYYDQWAFYAPLFEYKNLWQLFNWQHGPHRQGIGLIVSKILADLTEWNTVADSLAIVVLLSAGMILAYVLKHRLFGSFTLWDLTIPLLFLTLFQYEGIVVVVNLSYGAFPIVLIMLYCLALLMKKKGATQYTIILVLNFLLIYTGWGLFMGSVSIIFFTMKFYSSLRSGKDIFITGAAGIIAVISQFLFFTGYRFDPAVSCFDISTSYALQYPVFMGLMLAAFFGLHIRIMGALAIPAGLFLLAILIFVLVYHGRRVIKQGIHTDQVSLIITILISYSLLFCFVTAIGRVCTGLDLAQVSRYTTLLIPAFLALYFHLATIKTTRVSILILASYIGIASLGSLPFGIIEGIAEQTYIAKLNWKSCYLQSYDIESCNEQTNFMIYPFSNDQFHKELDYLRENRLNLFKEH
jgi:hypothetical protein